MKTAISSLNYLAAVETSSYSRVNLDFILSTGSYSENSQAAMSVQCLPCLESNKVVHKARNSVTSVALKLPGTFVSQQLKILLDLLLYGNGGDYSSLSKALLDQFPQLMMLPKDMRIYRMKGVFHMEGSEHLSILQAVHTIFELEESSYAIGHEEDKTAGLNPVVIIGTKLATAQVFESLFNACIVSVNS
ncbi:GTP-binding protein [archaeon]|nr:MAG: GTP-binding protein [archaeon]